MRNWTAAPVAAEGPSKRRTLLTFYAARPKAQPAQLVRGSSRRIMTMRFRPANIRVINRRECSCAAIGPAVQTQSSKPTSGNVFPLRRPSQAGWMPERCSQSRVRFAAPKSGAPLTTARRSGWDGDRDGRLRREHFTTSVQRKRPACPPAEASRPEKQTRQTRKGLTRSLHIRTASTARDAMACISGSCRVSSIWVAIRTSTIHTP